MSPRLHAAFIVVACWATSNVAAQTTQARISINAGTATDVTGVRSQAITASPTLIVRPGPSSVLSLRGVGTRFDNNAWSAGGGASFGARRPSGRTALTIDGAGDLTTTSYDLTYATADVLPGVEARLGVVTLFGAARAAVANIRATASVASDPFGALGDRSRSVTRHGLGALAGASARFVVDDVHALVVTGREERGRVADASQIDRAISASLEVSALTVGGSLGARSVDGERTSFGAGSVSVTVTPAVSLDLAAGRYAANRLTGAAAGSFASAGLSVRVGGRTASVIPRPRGVAVPAAGLTRLALRANDASRVEVAGDFNQWMFVPAARAENGVWYADLRIPPGEYRYAFRVDGGAWRIPDGVRAARDDDFGGTAALLVVPVGSGRQ